MEPSPLKNIQLKFCFAKFSGPLKIPVTDKSRWSVKSLVHSVQSLSHGPVHKTDPTYIPIFDLYEYVILHSYRQSKTEKISVGALLN